MLRRVKKIEPLSAKRSHFNAVKWMKNKRVFSSYLKVQQRTKCLNHSIQTHENRYLFLL